MRAFLFYFLLQAVQFPVCAAAPDLGAPAAADPGDVSGVRDRLLTGLFFRGELADRIMAAGMQGNLVELSGRETRSEVRLALMDWIKQNPERAARLHFYIDDMGRTAPRPGEEIKYALPTWDIKRDFAELARGVDKAAADRSLGDEEMSLIAQRLFDRPSAPPEEYAPGVAGASGKGPAGSGRSAEIKYADYRLNGPLAERERLALNGWFERVKNLMDETFRRGGGAGSAAPFRKIYENTVAAYRDFTLAISETKGRSALTGGEAARLEELRRALRKNLSVLEAMLVSRRLTAISARLPKNSPGSKTLSNEAVHLEAALGAFVSSLEDDADAVKTAALRLSGLEDAVDFWMMRFLAHARLMKLKGAIEDRKFSCVFDSLVFAYLLQACPSADYIRLAGELSARSGELSGALEAVARGDPGGTKDMAGRISAMETGVRRLAGYSRLNRRLQFIFWDALVNPFGLEPSRTGISADCKLLY